MKRLAVISALLMCLLITKAQVKSSHDGFYEKDSVFYQLSGADSFRYCVNCYTADSLKKYTGGVWLYSREHAVNTWENSRFSNKKDLTDTSSVRADVVKGNTIWVRVFKQGGYIDEHHFVFLGTWKPKAAQVISVFLDSADFMGRNGFYGPGEGQAKSLGYRWNYRLKIEKKCTYEVFAGKHFELEAQQNAGLEISAQESADYPDKAMQLNADKKLPKEQGLALGKNLTDLLGDNIKTLRFRLGGSNHRSNIIANEIATGIIRPDLGGMPSAPVCVFVNGSFWTYAMAEEAMGPSRVAKELSTPRSKLVTAKIPPVLTVADIKKMGLGISVVRDSISAICGFLNVCQVFYIYNDTLQFHIDSADVEHYNVFEDLCRTVYKGSVAQITGAIDRESFYRYALAIWFFQNGDSWGNHLTIAKAETRPWQLFGEHFDFSAEQPLASDWDKYFTNFAGGRRDGLPLQVTKKLLRYDRDYFCLVLEDELNTTYNSERTVPVAGKKMSSIRPCMSECSKAWWPNDWIDSVSWEQVAGKIVPFLEERPNTIAKALPKIFMTGNDTLFELKDRNNVTVKFDHAAGTDITVRLNSLEIKTDFTGKYYPKPDLHISLQYDAKKYEFVKWLEYATAAASFTVSADKAITLTPVMTVRKNK